MGGKGLNKEGRGKEREKNKKTRSIIKEGQGKK